MDEMTQAMSEAEEILDEIKQVEEKIKRWRDVVIDAKQRRHDADRDEFVALENLIILKRNLAHVERKANGVDWDEIAKILRGNGGGE